MEIELLSVKQRLDAAIFVPAFISVRSQKSRPISLQSDSIQAFIIDLLNADLVLARTLVTKEAGNVLATWRLGYNAKLLPKSRTPIRPTWRKIPTTLYSIKS